MDLEKPASAFVFPATMQWAGAANDVAAMQEA